MKCAFCSADTTETYKQGKIIVFVHWNCLEMRKEDLRTSDVKKCLLVEDQIRQSVSL